MRAVRNQLALFDDNQWRKSFQVIQKLPYKFSYCFEDEEGNTRKLRVLEWQLGALYWNTLRSAEGNEAMVLSQVRKKYFDEFLTKDLHFFVGTTQEFHFRAPNPWLVIGVFPIPRRHQGRLF